MPSIQERQVRVATLIKTANELDVMGHLEDADRMTKLAAKEAEEIAEDVDAEDADGPVDSSDPRSKGFGRSLCNLQKKIDKMSNSPNLTKKIQTFCDSAGCKLDARAIRNALETLADALSGCK
jgi:hypothetical protein